MLISVGYFNVRDTPPLPFITKRNGELSHELTEKTVYIGYVAELNTVEDLVDLQSTIPGNMRLITNVQYYCLEPVRTLIEYRYVPC